MLTVDPLHVDCHYTPWDQHMQLPLHAVRRSPIHADYEMLMVIPLESTLAITSSHG